MSCGRAVLWLVVAGLAALMLVTSASAGQRCSAHGITDDYDALIRIAAERWMPVEMRSHWCALKAQCWVESRLDPDATSPAGARGLCQVLPSTAGDFGLRGKLGTARNNLKAAALAWDRFWRVWISPRSHECRWRLTVASYNAGAGHIIAAQRLAGGAPCWERIRHELPAVTGHHARETTDYVDRVERAWHRLRGHRLF